MSTTAIPTTPSVVLQGLSALPAAPTVGLFRTFLKDHERLILAVIFGLTVWFAIGKVDTLVANHDNANLQQSKVVAAAQIEKNQATATLVAQQATDMKALNDKVQSQNAALEQANVALASALVKQQQVDKTMTPTELTQRWNVLVPQAAATVTPTGVALPSVGAIATVVTLETVPVLQKQLDGKSAELANANQLLVGSTGQVATLNTLVQGKDLLLADNAKVCTAQIAVVKAEARKSKRRWFVAGFVAGFLSRQAIKKYLGF